MNRLAEVFGSATAQLGIDLDATTRKFTELKALRPDSSTLLTTLQTRKACIAMGASVNNTENLIAAFNMAMDGIEDRNGSIGDVKPEYTDVYQAFILKLLNYSDLSQIDTLWDTFMDRYEESNYDPISLYELAQYDGDAPTVWVDVANTEHVQLIACIGPYNDSSKCYCFAFSHARGSASLSNTWIYFPTYHEKDQDQVLCLEHQVDPNQPVEIRYVAVETYLDSLNENQIGYEVLNSLIDVTYVNGQVPSTAIHNILDSYGDTPVTETIRQQISQHESFSRMGILTIISKVLEAGFGSHSEGARSYRPLKTQGFISNIIATVVTLVVTILIAILSIVFHAIAAILATVFSLVMMVFDKLVSSYSLTNLRIDHFGEIPIFSDVGQPITWGIADFRYITQIAAVPDELWLDLISRLEVEGVIFVPVRADNPLTSPLAITSPFGVLLFKGDGDGTSAKVILQPVVVANASTPIAHTEFLPPWDPQGGMISDYGEVQIREWSNPGADFTAFELHPDRIPWNNWPALENPSVATAYQFEDPTITTKDDSWILEVVAEQMSALSVGLTRSMYLGKTSWEDIPNIQNYVRNLDFGTASRRVFGPRDFGSGLQYIWEKMQSSANQQLLSSLPNYAQRALAIEIFRVMSTGYCMIGARTGDFTPTSGFGVYKHWRFNSWEEFHYFVSNFSDLFAYLAVNQMFCYSRYGYHPDSEAYITSRLEVWDDWFMNGISALDPSFITPQVSKKAILSAAIAMGVTAAAIGTTVLITKTVAKKKAPARIAAAEAGFEKAKEEYNSNPTPANRKKMAKANKKLTRSWKRAKRAGLAMYNGFDTGASSTSVSDALDKLSSEPEVESATNEDIIAIKRRIGWSDAEN